MPRPTTDRVIHDYTAKILPATMILTLVIFTVVVLVYSIGEKAAVPRDAAVAFAGIVFGFSGLWLLGHLVMYCRGAQAVSPPPLALPLPLTGIATGVGATTMAVPSVPQVPQVPATAVEVVMPSAVHQQQRVFQSQNNQHREYRQPNGYPPQLQPHSQPQDHSHRQVLPPQQEQQHQKQREDGARAQAEQREQQNCERQQREQQQYRGQGRGQQAEAEAPVQSGREEQRKHESHRRLTDHEPYVKEPPYPESLPGAYQEVSQEEHKKLAQQRRDQCRQQQVEQQQQQGRVISGPLENVWQKRPSAFGNQPAPVTVPGPIQQRQQPKGPRTMTGKPPGPLERVSSLQKSLPGTSSRTHRSSSLSRSRFNQPSKLSRGASNLPRPVWNGRSGDASETIGERGRPRVDRSRPDQNQDIEPEPRSASIRSASLDSATRASLKSHHPTLGGRLKNQEPSVATPLSQVDDPTSLNLTPGVEERKARPLPTTGYQLFARCLQRHRTISQPPFSPLKTSNSGSRGKPRSIMTDFQTNVVFMPDYNFTATELLNPICDENGSFPFLGYCEGDGEKVASGEELEDRGVVVMVCSSDDAGQWLIKLVELAESFNEAEGDAAE
ncbi:developmental regulator flbA [Colletotrichum scovillei]|uniref:Developmental regulator flbA n=1 Tax=Colletotrichum scovillei TaxID=1209932 RepID=A0A9P7RFS6_9PEZI|nr:developmental regulator flbA [Colletotrichum scovillei]KAG7083456.1 developmental regulator flbA [Colletotrichum scovillei]